MPIEPDELKNLILAAMTDAEVEILDLAGDKDHYEVKIISNTFKGKSRIEQHKIVQNIVRDKNIHALAIKTSVP